MMNFNHERLMIIFLAIGGCFGGIGEVLNFAHKRMTFGKRLIDHDVIRAKIAKIIV